MKALVGAVCDGLSDLLRESRRACKTPAPPTTENPLAEQHALLARYESSFCRLYRARYHGALPDADIDQVVRLGMLEAARRWDAAKGSSYPSYADRHIRPELRRACKAAGHGRHDASLEATPDGEHTGLALAECISSDWMAPEDAAAHHEVYEAIRRLVDTLPPTERLVIVARYAVADGTSEEMRKTLAEQLGVSGPRVTAIEQRAIQRIRSGLEKRSHGE